MVEVSVRAADAGDVDGVLRVAHESWHAAHDDIVGPETVDDVLADQYDSGSVRSAIDREGTVYRVAETELGTVGFAIGVPVEDGNWALSALYVDPEWWGEGIGSGLLAAVEAGVVAAGADRLRLSVMAENARARAFYEAQGYDHVDDHYDDALDVEAADYARSL